MKRKLVSLAVALLFLLGATPTYADGIPNLPHDFYGSVMINGVPAPIGTMVEARGTGVDVGIDGNPTYTVEAGIYGTANPYDPRLVVQGDIKDGATLTFYVNDVSTGKTEAWHSGEVTELDLSVTITAPPGPSGGGGVSPGYDYVKTKIFGVEKSFRISDEGEINDTIKLTSKDGRLTLLIPKGTFALDKNGKPLKTLEAIVDESPPEPPEETNIIGLAYNFEPDGATFDPPLSLTFTYDPYSLPEGADPDDLVLAYYDEDAGAWVELDCVVDTEAGTITAQVSHFTTFALLIHTPESEIPVEPPPPTSASFSLSNLVVEPREVHPGETVNITVSVSNSGGSEGDYVVALTVNGMTEIKLVTLPAGGSEIVSFSVTAPGAGEYSVSVGDLTSSFTVVAVSPPPLLPDFWRDYWVYVVGGVALLVIIVVVLLVARRRRY